MERRLILALVLSMGILFLWNVVINPPPPKAPTPVKKPAVAEKAPVPDAVKPSFDEPTAVGEKPESMLPALNAESDAPAVAETDTPAIAADSEEKSADTAPTLEAEPPAKAEAPVPAEQNTIIETNEFLATFTNRGARLKSFILKSDKYSEPVPGSEDERRQVDVVTVKEPENFPGTLLFDQANFSYDPDTTFELEDADDTSVVYRYETPQGVVLRKRFAFKGDYVFSLILSVENRAAAPASFFPKIRLVSHQNDANVQQGIFGSMPLNLQIPKAFIDGELYEETDKEELQTAKILKGQILWAGIDDRYFLLSLLPPDDLRSQITIKNVQQASTDALGTEGTHNWLAVTHMLEKQRVMPGESKDLSYQMFIGPKEYTTLTKVGHRLDESVDFWVLGALAKPMLWVLKYSYKFVYNWGIAIIILTILIKLILYPLTYKSFQSMQKMKELKPKMDELKAKHGEDKQEFNKQMMELYKREGVNPMGGCLPMLLQMPVYIALYKMLQNAVELYNEPFIPGWLTDLVRPDPYYILPALLGVLMFVQQKLTPTPDSQQQKMMMYMMPVMMFVFMLVLPSGLVLYILANTVMTIAQQWWIGKKSAQAKEAAAAKA